MFCAQCGTQHPEGAKFCGKCGSRLDQAPSPTAPPASGAVPPTPAPPAPTMARAPATHSGGLLRDKRVMLGAGGVLVVALLVGGILALNAGKSAEAEEAVKIYLEALRQEQGAKAFALTSSRFQQAVPESAYLVMARAAVSTVKKSTFIIDSRSVSGDVGRVRGKLIAKNASAVGIEFVLARENEQWKVDTIEMEDSKETKQR